MEKVFNKLVRDKIPEIIVNNGEKPFTRILGEKEYKKELEKKLQEELEEALSSKGKDRIEELADMLEVIKCLAEAEGYSINDVVEQCDEKRLKRGSFNNRTFLEKTSD